MGRLVEGFHLFEGVFGNPDELMQAVIASCDWRQRVLNFAGKKVPQPRLTAWYGSKGYTYAGIRHEPRAMPPVVASIHEIVEGLCPNSTFNSVLLNQYRNGRDSIGWHSDDEPELGENPVIASVSLGAERVFCIREKATRKITRWLLPHNSVLVMYGEAQLKWEHSVPKDDSSKVRLNLTFRKNN